MRKGGLEPPRYCYRQPLKLVRLPIPPLPHKGRLARLKATPYIGDSRFRALKPSNLRTFEPYFPPPPLRAGGVVVGVAFGAPGFGVVVATATGAVAGVVPVVVGLVPGFGAVVPVGVGAVVEIGAVGRSGSAVGVGVAVDAGAATPLTTDPPKPPDEPMTESASAPIMNRLPRIVVARVNTVAPARAPNAA